MVCEGDGPARGAKALQLGSMPSPRKCGRTWHRALPLRDSA